MDRWCIRHGFGTSINWWVSIAQLSIITIYWIYLSNISSIRSRTVYFHALSSTREFSVPNYVLKNQTRSTSRDSYFEYSLVGDRGVNGQATAEYLDPKTNVLFYTQVNKDAIGCWNANKEYTPDTQGLVDSDSDALVFPNDLKVDNDGNLWILSDRMPIFLFKKLNPNEFNYRILTAKISDIIRETPNCAEWE